MRYAHDQAFGSTQHTDEHVPPLQVLAGGDFDCPGSILPGRCAFRSVHSAVSICSSMARCRSVLQYHNGTDGCSEPVAVLSTSWPTETNSYVAPTVDVLTKKTDKMVRAEFAFGLFESASALLW